MQYNPDLELIIVTRADGGVVSSNVTPMDDSEAHYHYMCVFYREEYARTFVNEKLNVPVFFNKKTMLELAKEFNSSIAWPGLSGISVMNDDDTVEYIDTGSFVSMALNELVDVEKKYGAELVVNGKIQDVEDIDFNRMYYIMTRDDSMAMVRTTQTEDGKNREWLVVCPNPKRLEKIASECGLPKKNREIYHDTLFGILSDFLPGGQLHGQFDGILYDDKKRETYITSKKLVNMMKKREKMLEDMLAQRDVYLDEHYFIGTYSDDCLVYAELNGTPYLLLSQRMDTMLKTLLLDEADVEDITFTNALTLREIIEDCPEEFGVALCLDDNPDHIINLKIRELMKIAHDGVDESTVAPYGDLVDINEYLLASRCTLVDEYDNHPIVMMVSDDNGDDLAVMVMADDLDILMDGLSAIEYPEESETKPTWLPTCEIFEKFAENNEAYECDGIMLFEDGCCAIIPKEDILKALEQWHELD